MPPISSNTIQPLISHAIPTCHLDNTLAVVSNKLVQQPWDDLNYVFVLDSSGKLMGFIHMASLIVRVENQKASEVMREIPVVLQVSDPRQKALVESVKHDIDVLPVVNENFRFVGAITSTSLIDLMHTEHLETFLLSSGISFKKHSGLKLAQIGLLDAFTYRLPWLLLGLIAALGLSFITSLFEKSLQSNIAIAYFIPVIAFIADSVGTQSEALAIRSLATLKINSLNYLFKEFIVGTFLGLVLGTLGALGALLISGDLSIAIVVGFALFAASSVASTLASLIPLTFKALDKDPALASGPIATALQDIISLVIYFLFVLWLV